MRMAFDNIEPIKRSAEAGIGFYLPESTVQQDDGGTWFARKRFQGLFGDQSLYSTRNNISWLRRNRL